MIPFISIKWLHCFGILIRKICVIRLDSLIQDSQKVWMKSAHQSINHDRWLKALGLLWSRWFQCAASVTSFHPLSCHLWVFLSSPCSLFTGVVITEGVRLLKTRSVLHNWIYHVCKPLIKWILLNKNYMRE